MRVKYLGNFHDYSGYGEAARRFVLALYKAGVDLTIESSVDAPNRIEFGETSQLLDSLKEAKPYSIKILHVTPDLYDRYYEGSGVKHIGHFFWETTAVPKIWVKSLNMMDELWIGCKNTEFALKNSGVNTPIFITPEPTPLDRLAKPFRITGDHKFVFYSIFQWTNRKNPRSMLKAYWREFGPDDNVVFIIKSLRRNISRSERESILKDMRKWATEEEKLYLPPVWFIGDLLTNAATERLHATGNCYVSSSRGEGWGLPLVDAMRYGNPCISIKWNGVTEWFGEENAYPIKWDYVSAYEEDWMKNYTGDQQWAEPDIKSIQERMREAYSNPPLLVQKGKKAREMIETFSYANIGNLMKERLLKL